MNLRPHVSNATATINEFGMSVPNERIVWSDENVTISAVPHYCGDVLSETTTTTTSSATSSVTPTHCSHRVQLNPTEFIALRGSGCACIERRPQCAGKSLVLLLKLDIIIFEVSFCMTLTRRAFWRVAQRRASTCFSVRRSRANLTPKKPKRFQWQVQIDVSLADCRKQFLYFLYFFYKKFDLCLN